MGKLLYWFFFSNNSNKFKIIDMVYAWFQIANYINGGHYSPHHDYVMKEKDPNHVSRKLLRLDTIIER